MDGNTHAINRYLAQCEAYEERKEALEAVKKLADAEERIEELEAKLVKAVDFTRGVIGHAGNSGDDYLAEQSRKTLAELKGQNDD